MTLITTCQSAGIRLTGERPSTVLGSGAPLFGQELGELAQEGASDIAKSHPWQSLVKIGTLTGDGSTTEFDLPSDYDRMLINSEMVDTSAFLWGYSHVPEINEWLWLTESHIAAFPGFWTIYADQFHFTPAPANAAVTKYAYITNEIITDAEGNNQSTFDAYNNTFRLSERLLMLWIVWKWREMKGMDAGSAQADFQKAFDEIAGRDKGARIFRSGRARFPGNVTPAYPYSLGS